MGKDKYGLDWRVWGKDSNSNAPESSQRQCSSSNQQDSNNSSENDDSDSTAQTSDLRTLNCTLKFLPNETTDFVQMCKVRAEFTGDIPKGNVSFSLFAKYKELEYDLKHEQTTEVDGNIADSELKLFYPDRFYDDLTEEIQTEPVYYYAKLHARNYREKVGEQLKLPIDNDESPLGFIKIKCILNRTGQTVANTACTLKSKGAEYSGTTDNNGVISYDNLALSLYILHLNYKGKEYSAPIHWQIENRNSIVVKMKEEAHGLL